MNTPTTIELNINEYLKIETRDILKVELIPWQLEELAVMVAKKLAKTRGSKPKPSLSKLE